MTRRRLLLLVFASLPFVMGFVDIFVPEVYRLQSQGRFTEVEQLITKEIGTPEKGSMDQHVMLCHAYSKQKKYDRLFACAKTLEARYEKEGSYTPGTLSDITAWPYVWRADAYTELGDYPRAVREATSALEQVEKKGLKRAYRIWSLAALGLAQALKGERENALRTMAALDNVGVFFPYTGLSPEKYNGLAKIAMALGDHAKALAYLEQDTPSLLLELGNALNVVTNLGGDRIFAYMELPKAMIMSRALLETGRIDAARDGYDKLLARPGTTSNGDVHWILLYDRGRIAEHDGKPEQAIGFYRRSVEVIEGQRATITSEASKIGFVGDKQAVYGRLVDVLIRAGRQAEAFEYVERSKSRALVDLLATQQDFTINEGDAAKARALLAQTAGAEQQAAQQISAGEDTLTRARSLVAQARQDLQAQHPELASLVTVGSVPLAEIQKLLPKGEALVEYYHQGGKLYGFVVGPDQVHALALDSTGLEQEVRAFRLAIENPAGADYLPLAQKLHQRLVAPLAPWLAEHDIVLVAHGPLHYLPFHALHDGRQFLVDRHALRALPSASVMKYLRGTGAAMQGMLALGNPDLGDSKYDLAHAQEEAQAVGQALAQARVLLRKEATETAFRESAPGFRYLHLASHGEFDPGNPLGSALLLAPDARNDGRLTAGEIYALRIGADLVTLSACETGLGSIASGDDIIGLTRGFLYAGANSILASLWRVDDQSTAQLMTRFYAGLMTMDKRQALRAAMLATRDEKPHPYYWAAFQLTGNAR